MKISRIAALQRNVASDLDATKKSDYDFPVESFYR